MTPAQVAKIMALVNKLKRFSHPIDRHEAAEVVAAVEAALRDAPQADSVKIPTGEYEAALMVLTGMSWLKDNAPHRLKTPSAPTAVERKPLFGEMIAQHPGLREEIAAEHGAPTAVEPDERAEFEAWATSKGIVLTTHESDGEYLWGTARDTWEAWRASKGTK